MKFLGIDVCPKLRTDADYVESVRRRVRRSKWFALLHACGFVLFLGGYFCLWRLITTEDSVLAAAVGPGKYIGIALGAFGGLMIVLAGQSAIWAGQLLQGQRTERLMLRFHDELQKLQTNLQPGALPNDGPATPLGNSGVTHGPPSAAR
jgi:hypothetical protein